MPSPKSSTGEPRAKAAARKSAVQARLDWDPLGLLAGVDEAGRGPLAGPVVAAAVILDDTRRIRGLADSKVLTPLARERLYDQIREKSLCCAVGEASVDEIDTLNIFHATMLAMKRAVEGLRLRPAKVLVDGNRLPKIDVLCEAIVGGDAKVKSISAASIIAKVTRDRMLHQLHEQFPQYGFAAHKGYGTPEHLEALRTHGPCVHHRKFFAPVACSVMMLGEGRGVAVAAAQ
ncbi:MAG: ribonuclease HII [Pseudomonadota bacterium]